MKYKLKWEKLVKGKEPEVLILNEDIERLYLEMKKANSKNFTAITGIILYLEKVK